MSTDTRVLNISSYDQGTVFGPGSEPKQSVFEQSADQKHRLGARYVDGDRTFRYAKSGAAGILKAKMTQSQVVDTDTGEIIQTDHAWAVGDVSGTMLIATGGTWARDEFVDGYFMANQTVVGDVYRVLASEITTTDTIIQLELETPIRTAISVTSEASLHTNRWYNVVIFPATTTTGYATGVPLIDVTNGYYFWAQTAGPCPVIVDGGDSVSIGNSVGFGTTDAGTCMTRTTLAQSFGNVLLEGAVDEVALINLSIDQ